MKDKTMLAEELGRMTEERDPVPPGLISAINWAWRKAGQTGVSHAIVRVGKKYTAVPTNGAADFPLQYLARKLDGDFIYRISVLS